jgi:hypothetical protein
MSSFYQNTACYGPSNCTGGFPSGYTCPIKKVCLYTGDVQNPSSVLGTYPKAYIGGIYIEVGRAALERAELCSFL